MALASAKNLLDELMGRDRNVHPEEKRSAGSTDWTDPAICRYYMIEFCPNSLFTNTKADMGVCNKVHDESLKSEFHKRAKPRDHRLYEDDFINLCQDMLNDVEKRIKRARHRLEASKRDADLPPSDEDHPLIAPHNDEQKEKIKALETEIETLLERAQQLGADGEVGEAEKMISKVDRLKEEKNHIKKDLIIPGGRRNDLTSQEKQMEVCDVCGALLIVNDVQQRVDDHLKGKQHIGYGKLKTTLDALLQRRRDAEDGGRPNGSQRRSDRSDRHGTRESSSRDTHERGDRGGGGRDREGDERDRSQRHRSRSPVADRYHSQSTSSRDGNHHRHRDHRDSDMKRSRDSRSSHNR